MPLEDLEKELYGQKRPQPKLERKEAKPSGEPASLDESKLSESREELIEEESSFFSIVRKFSRGLLIFLVIGVVILAGIVAWLFWHSPSSEEIIFKISGPTESIMIGVPFELKVELTNNSNTDLRLGKLILNLPEGVAELGHTPEEQATISRYLGEINSGGFSEQTFSLVALSGERVKKEFKAVLTYTTPGLGAEFERQTKTEVNITEPAIYLDIRTPQKVISGENFEIEISYQNLSDTNFNDLELELTYPPNFEYREASLKPTKSNNLWKIDKLLAQERGNFTLKGNIIGKADSFFEISSDLRIPFLGRLLSVNKKSASIVIAPSPLLLEIAVNGQNDYTAHLQDVLNYEIKYQNNSEVGLQDVILKIQLIGEMFDFSTLKTKSFFSSLDNTLTWNAAVMPNFKMLTPGAKGSVQFSIGLKDAYPIKRLGDKNYLLKVKGQIESPTVPYFVSAEKTLGLTSLETKVAGQITIDAQAFFNDAASGIINAGPFPPKVNTPTNYTIHWQIKTFASDFKDIEVRAFLLSGVTWTGKIKTNLTGSQPEFNERTSEVVWKIDRLIANKGVINQPVEAIFQISAVPSVNQLGQVMPLISETQLKAFDEFAELKTSASDRALDTRLPDDPTAKEGRVQM